MSEEKDKAELSPDNSSETKQSMEVHHHPDFQMKSSGALRYFDKAVAYDAANYDRICRMMQTTEISQNDIYTEARKSRAMIFEFRYNDIANNIARANNASLVNTSHVDQQKIETFIETNPPLLSYDRILINQYIEPVRSRFLYNNVMLADSLLNQSTKLIRELKEKYDPPKE